MRPAPEPPIRLHAVPERRIRPCPSRVLAVLGYDSPTLVRCSDEEGHDGPHHRSIHWDDSAAVLNATSEVDS